MFRFIFNIVSRAQTPTLIALLLFLLAIILGVFFFFGTKNSDSLANYARRNGLFYIIAFFLLSSPILAAIVQRFSSLGRFSFFPIIIIFGIFIELIRGRRRSYGLRGMLFNDELLDAPFYQGYDPISIENSIRANQAMEDRQSALRRASIYLKPYNNPMGNHTLQNKFCIFNYMCDGAECTYSCIAREGCNSNILSFKVVGIQNKDWNNDCFTSILNFFSYGTDVNALYTFFSDKRNFRIIETKKIETNTTDDDKQSEDLIDINTASEEELSKLPGINIVLAKKIISHRETNGAFKSFDEFIKVMGMKSHYARKIKNLIRVSKVKKIEKTKNARVLDI